MSRLIESIRVFNGVVSRLDLHESRMRKSFQSVYKKHPDWSLKELLGKQSIPPTGLYKCRVVYDDHEQRVEFSSYEPRMVRTLKLMAVHDITYKHKWEDREQLTNLFSKRGDCDDILIVNDGLVTDSFYANIVFEKAGKWFTPESYLLPGTMRADLLRSGGITACKISRDDLNEYSRFKLINAMLEFESPAQPITNIIS